MALTPGGRRSPGTQLPPSPGPVGQPGGSRGGRKTLWPRSASVSLLRLGLLIGGLVIIADLSAQAIIERTLNVDDATAVETVDELANYVLFSLLGILIVRDTGLMYAGLVAGVFASLLDAIVVAAATLMAPQAAAIAPPATTMSIAEEGFVYNLAIGTAFAGASGVVYALVQRMARGRKSR
jgi:hypothetical protein